MQGRNVNFTVDPGLGGTGVIAWKCDNLEREGIPLIAFDHFSCTSKLETWHLSAMDIAMMISGWARRSGMSVVRLYIEFPRAFRSAAGIAAINRGDIFKLVYLIGCIRATFPLATFKPIPVEEWKGQLPKTETIRRCKKIMPPHLWLGKSTHLWDAYGIGLYLQGRF